MRNKAITEKSLFQVWNHDPFEQTLHSASVVMKLLEHLKQDYQGGLPSEDPEGLDIEWISALATLESALNRATRTLYQWHTIVANCK